MKYRKCKLCGKRVKKEDAAYFHVRAFCSYDHLKEYIRSEDGKRYINRESKAQTLRDKQKLKTKGDWLKEAQMAFNKYIRFRDIYHNRECISCKKAFDGRANQWDAGHLHSVKLAPALRFNVYNCNLQCVQCNRYGYGMPLDYQSYLRARIGKEKVDWLADHRKDSARYSVEYLQRIKKIFNKRANRYKNKVRRNNECTII